MPRVPTYDGPQVRTQALQGGFQQGAGSAAPFGAVAGQQLQQLGQSAQNAGEAFDRIALRKEQDDAFRVETAVKAEWLQFEQNLRRTRQGRNAEGLTAEAEAWWEEAKTRHAANLSPRAQQLVNRSLGQARLSGISALSRYQDQELERSADQSTAAAIGVEIQRAATVGDPAEADVARRVINDHLAAMGARKGWSAEEYQVESLRYTDMLHKRMIDNLVDANPEAALAYFEANREEIDASAHSRIEEMVAGAAAEQKAEQLVAGMASLPYAQQLEQAGAIDDPKVRRAALDRVRQQQQDLQVARAEQERAASDQIWQMIANGAGMRQLPASVLAQMDGRERQQVTDHFRAQRERAAAEAAGRSVQTDWTLYTQLREMPKEEFLRTRLSTYVDRIAGPQMEQLLDLQDRLRTPARESEAVSMEQQLSATTAALALQPEERGQFQSTFFAEVQAFKNQHGREPNFDERQKILDRLSIEGEVRSGSWWRNDPNVPLYQVPLGDRERFVPDISRSDRREIIERFRANGVERPTEEQITQAYRAWKGL